MQGGDGTSEEVGKASLPFRWEGYHVLGLGRPLELPGDTVLKLG